MKFNLKRSLLFVLFSMNLAIMYGENPIVISSLSPGFTHYVSPNQEVIYQETGMAFLRNCFQLSGINQGLIESIFKGETTLFVNQIVGEDDTLDILIDREMRVARISDSAGRELDIFIVDLTGTLLFNDILLDGFGEVDLASLSHGMYIIICSVENRIAGLLKFMI